MSQHSIAMPVRTQWKGDRHGGWAEFYDANGRQVFANQVVNALNQAVSTLQELLAEVHTLKRERCDCEYDYRCGQCEKIIRIQTLVKKLDPPPQ